MTSRSRSSTCAPARFEQRVPSIIRHRSIIDASARAPCLDHPLDVAIRIRRRICILIITISIHSYRSLRHLGNSLGARRRSLYPPRPALLRFVAHYFLDTFPAYLLVPPFSAHFFDSHIPYSITPFYRCAFIVADPRRVLASLESRRCCLLSVHAHVRINHPRAPCVRRVGKCRLKIDMRCACVYYRMHGITIVSRRGWRLRYRGAAGRRGEATIQRRMEVAERITLDRQR
jgi:hypothetical protein